MGAIAFFGVVYLVIKLLVLGLGCASGWLLYWLLQPRVDLGTALLIGVVAAGFSIEFFTRLMTALRAHELKQEEDENEIGRPITLFSIETPRTPRRRRKKT